ncbi:DUF6397 family protein [Streptomyces sp. WAC06614]|uniref:DUF6397 family protein n=1 Tax=Streptomyces sp. WAC06614 TaxID=2487416 RepID=UPI000F7A1E4F|nr:DUF6397 family protein [Streptomyces sp. WAC06614]RSS78350.1 hypothetical protein EF918_21270 [Streptomyces sp. WAC06614]
MKVQDRRTDAVGGAAAAGGAGVVGGARVVGGPGEAEGAQELVPGARAAGELGLRRGEFHRAVQLGLVRAGPRMPGAGVRFARAELERVRAGAGFPEDLREQVETVGAAAAAELLGIGPSRFTRLARCGHVVPVAYRINRYRAVVWLYLARELREFARREQPGPLRGGVSPEDRELILAGTDLRPRRWRERHVELLLRRTADPWARAAVLASVLPEETVREAVPDEAERVLLSGLAPPPPYGHPQAPAAAQVAERLLRAEQPDEVDSYRSGLAFTLTGARRRPQSKTTGERGPT